MKDVVGASTLLACVLFSVLFVINSGCSGSAGVTSPNIPKAPALNPHVQNIAGCQIFPADNAWNTDISGYPVDANSAGYISYMNSGNYHLLHNFHQTPASGIPYNVVPGSQSFVPITFTLYGSQSDPGPYPIPSNALIEQDGDAHVLVLDSGNCTLYEMWKSTYIGPGWDAGSGAIFNLGSNTLRTDGWASADAAGLPILPGLVRYEEVASGAIAHALRFATGSTQAGFIHPATHFSSSITDPNAPPMGLRVRLKASFDLSPYAGQSLVILTALKKYGMFVADNGGNWDISGVPNPNWDETNLNQLGTVPASAFEVVQTGTIIH